MAEDLPPGTPEVDDPLLVADLIRLLSIKGAIGRLPLADIVIPVVNLGDVVQPTVEIRSPAFRSTDVFSAGVQVGAGANTVHADTGALVAGVFDVQLSIDRGNGTTNHEQWAIEHRNAANTANLAVWNYINSASRAPYAFQQTFAYEFAVGERLRIINVVALVAGDTSNAVIFARRRE